jgi:hypothetical protein
MGRGLFRIRRTTWLTIEDSQSFLEAFDGSSWTQMRCDRSLTCWSQCWSFSSKASNRFATSVYAAASARSALGCRGATGPESGQFQANSREFEALLFLVFALCGDVGRVLRTSSGSPGSGLTKATSSVSRLGAKSVIQQSDRQAPTALRARAGRFSVNTSATTRKKHYRTHVDEARSSSVAETQSAGARRLFSKTPADPAAEAWAWAFVSNGLSYRLIDDAFRAAVAKTMPQNRASLTQDVRNLASELRHETRARLEGQPVVLACDGGTFIGSPSSTSSSRLCVLAVLFFFVLDK